VIIGKYESKRNSGCIGLFHITEEVFVRLEPVQFQMSLKTDIREE
jgi:hypothetical protein